MKQITIDDINLMSYTDFVGFVNQWNVLPGSYTTLSKWGVFSHIDNSSRILELACTSGFSIREICNLFGASGVGLDISAESINSAIYNKERYAANLNIKYIVENGDEYKNAEKFSHIIVGAALKFFPNPQVTIDRIINNYLQDGGYLLASPFYITSQIPKNLIDEAKGVFGITITTTDYKETMELYKKFEIVYEDRNSIQTESKQELEHYCTSTIDRACKIRNINNSDLKKAMFDRLMKIKLMSNKLRPYQNFSTLVLRYRKDIYPNRYTELF